MPYKEDKTWEVQVWEVGTVGEQSSEEVEEEETEGTCTDKWEL